MFHQTLFLLLVLYCTEVGAGFCEYGWVRFNDSCYKFQRTKERWSDASSICKTIGGVLASVGSADENVFLRQFLFEIVYYDGAWIGGTDSDSEGTWKWVTGEPLTYTSWGPGEPDSHNGWDEDCMCLRPVGWADYACNDLFAYVCEKNSTRST